jgi:hypothetical protein
MRQNGFADVVTIVRGKVEEIDSLPGVDKVRWLRVFILFYFLIYY